MNDNKDYLQEFEQLLAHKNTKLLLENLKSASVVQLSVLFNRIADHILDDIQQHQDVELTRQQAEKFRPVMHYAVEKLMKLYLQQGELLSKENEAVAGACNKFLKIQYKAYMMVFNHARQHAQKKGLLAISIHRIMVIQLYLHIISYFMYSAIPGKQWFNLHQFYAIAKKNDLSEFAVQDEECYVTKLVSIRELYSYSVLLGCACLHHLNVISIIKTVGCVFEWANLVEISDEPQNLDNEIVVDISAGSAPNFRKFFVETDQSVFLYLHLDKLLDTIQKQTTENNIVFNKTGVTDDLKAHLIEAWSKYRIREERVSVNQDLEATIGFCNIHYYLCGGRELKDFLGERVDLSIVYEKDEHIALIEQQRSGDVWSPGLSAPSGKLVDNEVLEAFSFQRHFEMNENINSEKFPTFNIRMLDKSLHGCRLEFPKEAHFDITMGDLIGFRDFDSHWQVGEIAWFRIIENKVMSVGVRLLSTQAIPLGVDVPLRLGAHKNYTEGVLLPYEDALKSLTSILFLDEFFEEGECLKVVQKGLVNDLKLTNKLHSDKSYSQFNCGFYVPTTEDDDIESAKEHHKDKIIDVGDSDKE